MKSEEFYDHLKKEAERFLDYVERFDFKGDESLIRIKNKLVLSFQRQLKAQVTMEISSKIDEAYARKVNKETYVNFEDHKEFLEKDIIVLGLAPLQERTLRARKMNKIKDLIVKRRIDLLEINNIAEATLARIEYILSRNGLCLNTRFISEEKD